MVWIKRKPSRGPLPGPDRVAELMALIANNDVPYPEWVAIAYAVFGATAGKGFDIFERWSSQSTKHDPDETMALWQRIGAAGHVRSGFGTIKRLSEKVVPDTNLPEPDAPVGEPPEPPGGSPPEPEDDEPSELVPPEYTDNAMALEWSIGHHDILKFVPEWNEWYRWDRELWRKDHGVWVSDTIRRFVTLKGEQALRTAGKGAHQIAKSVNRQRTVAAIEKLARHHHRHVVPAHLFDSDPWLAGTDGGVLDLRTGKLRPGRPEDLISKRLGFVPAATAGCPRFLSFLGEALNHKTANLTFLQRWLGYCLTGSVREEFFLFLLGPPGTGKGTLTKILHSILGDYVRSVPMEMFTTQNWHAEYYRAQLVGRRLIIAAEPGR
jgi:hypothetical protein